MTSRSTSCLIAIAVLTASGSVGFAQSKATGSWVDPPSSAAPADETVTYPNPPAESVKAPEPHAEPATVDGEAPPAVSDRPVAATIAKPATAKPASTGKVSVHRAPARTAERPVTKPVKTATTKRARRVALVRADRDVAATGAVPSPVERRYRAESSYRRIRSVQDALDAGLTVTRVRTFQLPDGRRVEVETDPDPRTRLDLLVRPY